MLARFFITKKNCKNPNKPFSYNNLDLIKYLTISSMTGDSVVIGQTAVKNTNQMNNKTLKYTPRELCALAPKNAYVPPHLRAGRQSAAPPATESIPNSANGPSNANVTRYQGVNNNYRKNDSNNNTNNTKPQKGNFRRSEKSWRASSSSSESEPYMPNHNWNNQKKQKKQPVEPKEPKKPHCEVILTDLPPQLRSMQNLATFFHPYGEVSQIQIFAPKDELPANILKFTGNTELSNQYSALVEFLTARVAKFVVGVLRKRLRQLNFRVGLVKPGLEEELTIQKNTIGEISHTPSSIIFDKQNYVPKSNFGDSSSDSSEIEMKASKRIIKRYFQSGFAPMDQAYWTQSSPSGSSESGPSSESDPERTPSPHSLLSDDDCEVSNNQNHNNTTQNSGTLLNVIRELEYISVN
jgi:hypothetical protein